MNSSLVRSLLFLGVASQVVIVTAQSSGTFTATGSLITVRHSHSATLLTNGRVLIAGGAIDINSDRTVLASAELYDPSTGTFTATGEMTRARSNHTATLLPDGKVVIVGGSGEFDSLAEIYDPASGTFTATGQRTKAFYVVTAVLLPNGKVLIAGYTGFWDGLTSAELYDPFTKVFTATGEMTVRGRVTACLLSNGKVLISGNRWSSGHQQSSDEIYDPDTGIFSPTRTTFPYIYKSPMSAQLLKNGKVLITLWDWEDEFVRSAEIYDPSTGAFTAAFGNYAELYNSATATLTLSRAGPMLTGQASGRAHTLLPEGNVLISGGWICCGTPGTTIATAEIYHPAVLVPAPVLLSLSGDGQGQGAIQHSGTYRIASATDPAVAGEYLTIYGTGLLDGSVIPPQVAIGGRLAEILFFGNAPGFPGLNQLNVRMPSGVVPGTAV
ncbi:MAG: kelch repeat-containing protein, partial [Bryobacteraceae bacterium]